MAASNLKLYTYPNNSRAFKALIPAQYGGLAIEVVDVQMGVTNKTPEFLALNPRGQVPTLATPEGGVWESNAIAKYVARVAGGQLLGTSAYEDGLIDSWMCFTASDIDMPKAAWLYPIFGYIPFSKEGTKQAKADLERVLGLLNEYLATRTYLVGERVTLADTTVAMSLLDLYKAVFEPSYRDQFVHTNRWFATIVNQPNVAAVVGPVALCTKMMAYDPSKNAAAAAPKDNKKKDAAPKEAAAKKEKPAKSLAEEAEEAAEAEERAPKKDEFSDLPPSSFDLDAWKKKYSNSDTRTEAMPWFWQNFDAAGFSIWKADYKYNSELRVPFMASNLVSGMFQRLPKLHKYAFASMLICGVENALHITGVWVFRGQVVPPSMLAECDDCEHYNWTKLDAGRDRAVVEDVFAWNGASLPAEVSDGKAFK